MEKQDSKNRRVTMAATAQDKTAKLLRVELPIDWLVPQEINPNEMSDSEFNMLCDNFEKVGWIDPVFVRKLDDKKYRIVGGRHRWEVGKLLGFTHAPCTVVDDPDFDADQEKFQIVRMNVIRGSMSPQKFMDLYTSLEGKYESEVMHEMFGFVEQEQLQKLIKQTVKSLPSEMQGEFQKAAKELKTVEGLSKLLNSMFTQYGDTLPYGYMCFDFGGKESVWLRMDAATKKALLNLGALCVKESRTVDDIVGGLIKAASNGEIPATMQGLIDKSFPVLIPPATEMPTADSLGVK